MKSWAAQYLFKEAFEERKQYICTMHGTGLLVVKLSQLKFEKQSQILTVVAADAVSPLFSCDSIHTCVFMFFHIYITECIIRWLKYIYV